MSETLRDLAGAYKDIALAPTQNDFKNGILAELEALIRQEVTNLKYSQKTTADDDEIRF